MLFSYLIKIFRLKRKIFKKFNPTKSQFSWFLLFTTMVASASTSVYLPCLNTMARDLHTSASMIQMTIVCHLISELFGRFFCGPLIDIVGKKHVLMPALTISILGQICCACSTGIEMLICMRILQALGSGMLYIISMSIISENFRGKEMSKILSTFELSQPLAWIISPIIGDFVQGQWRYTFVILAVLQIIIKAIFWTCLNNDKMISNKKKNIKILEILGNYKKLLSNKLFVIYAMIPGFCMSGYMMFASNLPFFCLNNSVNIKIVYLQILPLIFYILSSFLYRFVVNNLEIFVARVIGTIINSITAILLCFVFLNIFQFDIKILLIAICIQCIGSAFLVPVSVSKALEKSSVYAGSGASAVVMFRNIIMSVCLSISASLHNEIVFMFIAILIITGIILTLLFLRVLVKKKALLKK